jgi:hypothetical protein
VSGLVPKLKMASSFAVALLRAVLKGVPWTVSATANRSMKRVSGLRSTLAVPAGSYGSSMVNGVGVVIVEPSSSLTNVPPATSIRTGPMGGGEIVRA